MRSPSGTTRLLLRSNARRKWSLRVDNAYNLQATVLWQRPTASESHIYRLLRYHLRAQNVLRFRAAVAYVTWGGLSLIASDLEVFLRRGKILETIFKIK